MEAERTFRLVGSPEEIPVIEELLRQEGYVFEDEPFHAVARKLTFEPAPLGTSLAARFGRIYIQDRSSMLPPIALAPRPGEHILDMCAAPGSKTGMLSSLVGPEGFVLGNEPGDRLGTLRANLQRTNCLNTATTRGLAQNLPLRDESWQAIQLDPPCSGWGTANKDPKVRERWTPERLGPLMTLQRELLKKAASLLAPGGRLVYSTCTTHEAENEEQVIWALENLGLNLAALSPPPGFVLDKAAHGLKDVWRVAEESAGQGFFVAAFTKDGHPAPETAPKLRRHPQTLKLDRISGAESVDFAQLPPGQALEHNGRVFWTPTRSLHLMADGLKGQGTPVGKLAGRAPKQKFRPDALAWGLLPSTPSAEALQATTEDLHRLLSGQALAASGHPPATGLYWQGLRLGWLTRKGNRLLFQER